MKTLLAISLASVLLGGCVVVPAGPPVYGPRVYGPPVVVQPYYGYGPRYYHHHRDWD